MQLKMSRREVLAASVLGVTGSPRAFAALPAQSEGAVRLPERVRVGIIGLEGHYSEVVEPAASIPNIQIAAVAEKDETLLRRGVRNPRIKGAAVYGDYREMLDREKLDVVAICGANGVRASIVQACAERKLPVVAEKPLALSLEELAATRKKVAAGGAPLTMLLPMRFSPRFRLMRRLVEQGGIGEVISIGAQKSYKLGTRPSWMKARATYGGTIPYIGIHMVDLMRWVSGREFVRAGAFHSQVGFPEIGEMENNTAIMYQMDNRGTASLRMDYLRPSAAGSHGDDRLILAGSRGVIEYKEGREVTLISADHDLKELRDLPPSRPLFVDFLDALYNGARHLLPIEDIYRVNEIVLKTREAADMNKVTAL